MQLEAEGIEVRRRSVVMVPSFFEKDRGEPTHPVQGLRRHHQHEGGYQEECHLLECAKLAASVSPVEECAAQLFRNIR